MELSDIYKISLSIISSVGSAALIVLAFSSWLGRVWANRILETEKNKFATELEFLKTNNQNFINAVGVSNSLYVETQKVFANERINAVKELWAEISKIKKQQSSAITILDLFQLDEYVKFFQSPQNRYYEKDLSEALNKLLVSDIDRLRPFLDEKAYAYWFYYRALVGRISIYIQKIITEKHSPDPWQQNIGIVEILRSILTEEELQKFQNEKWGTTKLFEYLEANLAEHLRLLSSGSLLSKESLNHSMSISKAAEALREIEQKGKLKAR